MNENKTFNLASIIQESAVDVKGKTVILELQCRDEASAEVIYEYVLTGITSENGFSLKLRGERVA